MTNQPAPPSPPANLAIFVETLGLDGAIDFLQRYGGAELYIPETSRRTALARDIGAEKAAALAAIKDQLPRRIPTGKRWVAQVLRSKGLSIAAIARKLHMSDVTIRSYVNNTPDERQPDLFT